MVDLGLYNYVKIALEQGKSESDIVRELSKSNFTTENIQEAFDAVIKGKVPMTRKRRVVSISSIITSITILLSILLVVLFFTKYKNHAFPLTQDYTSYTVTVNVAPLQTYTEPEIGVTMSVPSDWSTKHNIASGAKVSGFTASKNVNPIGGTDIVTAQVNTHTSNLSFSDLVTTERAALSGNNSLIFLRDEDMLIGGQPGHVFEYTYVSEGKTYREMDAYVFNSNTFYVFSANGLSGDWNQIPALAMLKSITFITN